MSEISLCAGETVGIGAQVRHSGGSSRAADTRDEPAAAAGTVRRRRGRSGALWRRGGGGGGCRQQGARCRSSGARRVPVVAIPGLRRQVQLRPGTVLAERQPGGRAATERGRLSLHLRRRRRGHPVIQSLHAPHQSVSGSTRSHVDAEWRTRF